MKKVLLLLLVLLPVLGMGAEKLGMGYFIVVANPSLKPVFEEFIKFKQEQGFDVVIEDVPTIEKTVEGDSRGEKIRNWLKKEKTKGGYTKTFTLLVGTIRADEEKEWERKGEVWTGGEIPMIRVEDFATDHYYADLDLNKQPKKVSDFNNEVCNLVGRIPFSLKEVLEKYIQMLLKVEREIAQAKETPRYAFTICDPIFGLRSQTMGKDDFLDGSRGIEMNLIPAIKKSEAYSAIYTLYQKEGTISSPFSCTAPLNRENVIRFLKMTDILLTSGHGGVFMDVWRDINEDEKVDPGELKQICYFDMECLRENLPDLQERPIKLWYDDGCTTVIQGEYGANFNSPDFEGIQLTTANAVHADEALRFRIALNTVGWTAEKAGGIPAKSLIEFIFVERKVIGEILNFPHTKVVYREKKNKVSKVTVIPDWTDAWVKLCILGDPSFGFFPDSLKNSLPKTHSQK
jgi:hypothetical protein